MLLHPQDATLTRYAAGSAVESVRRRVANHLADCPRCRTVVQSTRDLRAELPNGGVPDAPSALFARIVESRANGARVLLPVEAPGVMSQQVEVRRVSGGGFRAPRPIFWVALGGVAAVALVQVGTRQLDAYLASKVGGERPRPAFPAPLKVDASVPAAGPFVATRLRPVTLRYGTVNYGGRNQLISERSETIQLVRSGTAGSEWIAISEYDRSSRGPDSIWINGETLEPVQWRQRYSRKESNLVSTFRLRNNQVHVERNYQLPRGVGMTPSRADSLVKANGPNDTTYSLPQKHVTTAMNRAHLAAMMMAAPLAPGWQGAFAFAWMDRKSFEVRNGYTIRIAGTRRVVTPAGVFDCWEAVRRSDSGERLQWYRKSDGVFVGEAGGTSPRAMVYRTLLLSED